MRRASTRAALLAALLFTIASASLALSTGASAAGTPPATPLPPSKVTVTRDLPYETVDGLTLTLDVYQPSDPGDGRPGIVLIHGGAWGTGKAPDVSAQARLLAREGWVAFSVNYRLADETHHAWPDELTDVQRATRWVGANAGSYGVDNQKIAALGLSAGGHLAALLAEVGTTVDATGKPITDPDPPVTIRAAAAWSPPTRLTGLISPAAGGDPTDCNNDQRCARFWRLPLVEHFLGCRPEQCPASYSQASPTERATAHTAPIWFANSTNEITGLPQADALDHALTAAGVDHHLEVVQGNQHADEYESKVWNKMASWLATKLGVAAPPPVSFSGSNILLSPVVVISVVIGLALLILLLAVALRDDEGEL
jgi:acetyl esterase/lipase